MVVLLLLKFNQAILGGAIYYKGTLNDILETKFRNNSAIQGGALYIDKSDATFGKSKFYNNSATHELRFTNSFNNMPTMGGAINIPGNGINVYDSEFINNTELNNTDFEFNQAILGGAIYYKGTLNDILETVTV